MPLLDAPPYDPRRDRRRNLIIVAGLVALVISALLVYWFWNWPQERVVNRFFSAIEKNDFESAYGIWMADPQWKQHPQKFPNYPFGTFSLDWGPSGEWGTITKHKIDCSTSAPKHGSGVIVVLTINDRAEASRLWVEKKDRSLSYSPIEIVCPHF